MYQRKHTSPRNCRVCGHEFVPGTNNYVRCLACVAAGDRYASGEAPLCACGCGGKTNPKGTTSRWCKFLLNHAPRVNVPPNKGRRTLHAHTCKTCGRAFENRTKNSINCSAACAGKAHGGANHHAWRGGNRTKHKLLDMGDHVRLEHLVVMEGLIGRPLGESEVVHHIDGNGLNNSPENLFLFHCQGCHRHHHMAGTPLQYEYAQRHLDGAPVHKYRNGERKRVPPKTCPFCGVEFLTFLHPQIFCSRKCVGLAKRKPIGTHAHVVRRGYYWALVGERGKPGAWRAVHRLAMESSIGRPLGRFEVVHHIDRNGLNNAIGNLFLFHCHACHEHHHNEDAPMAYRYPHIHAVASQESHV